MKECPRILVDPLISYGQPVVEHAHVPTSKIYGTWKAEGGSYPAVVDWYEIDDALAREAVEFEIGLLA
jgi:uncharacterized protein (DUF433 family)